jgi:MFS family permease
MALTVGFFLCCFSLLMAVGMIILDKRSEDADKNSGNAARLGDDEKFKWSDLLEFGTSFWLLSGSCVLTYMSIFPYIQICSDMLQVKYGFDSKTAGFLFGIPYIISAIMSPLLGLFIDKVGKRAFMICLSSVILIIAFTVSMFLPPCEQCYNEVIPLSLVGVGYSIYAAAIWGSVPYVVASHTVGTAFGLATAI